MAVAAAAASAASTADTRLPMREREEKGWDEGREIGCNGLVKAKHSDWIERN